MSRSTSVLISHASDMDAHPPGRSFVQAAIDGVLKAGFRPVEMRYFSAREESPADYCARQVRECGIYLGVIGFRYGSLVPAVGRWGCGGPGRRARHRGGAVRPGPPHPGGQLSVGGSPGTRNQTVTSVGTRPFGSSGPLACSSSAPSGSGTGSAPKLVSTRTPLLRK